MLWSHEHYFREPSKKLQSAIINQGNFAVKPLCETLEKYKDYEDCEIRKWAAILLGDIRNPESIDSLCLAIEKDDRIVQMYAVDALRNFKKNDLIKNRNVLPSLAKLALNTDLDSIALSATKALIELEVTIPVLIEIIKKKRKVYTQWHDEDYGPSKLEDNYVQRKLVLEALEKIGTPEALEAIEKYKM
ncbi:unnamed protein product [marine sediment metagenome]|uniref:HEAT repeat domain-containing protein n=1 Tax=marine sediment metagenome TaxID=412755 RepID=X1THB6_9ZZZZ